MTLDLEVNEVEVKGLTSLASVTEITGIHIGQSFILLCTPSAFSPYFLFFSILFYSILFYFHFVQVLRSSIQIHFNFIASFHIHLSHTTQTHYPSKMRLSLLFTSSSSSPSSAVVLASLTTALPLSSRQANTIQVQIKTGDGDAAIQITVTLDRLFTTPQKAVAASISNPTAVCQAFIDSGTTTPLGAPFMAANKAVFVNDGSTASVASDAITVGAFLRSSSSSKLLVEAPCR
jgi:hypothetical protein